MILTGFLTGRYARERPLALSASITFEQQYKEIEGDSASSAELYALLSSLTDIPLRQGLGVTGSVNQHGWIQPVGGINEKIEGFFDACRRQTLTGRQGVLIPETNAHHLMLREDVVDAVRAGRFHVYAVTTIDEGLALLSGREAADHGADGRFPEGGTRPVRLPALACGCDGTLAFADRIGPEALGFLERARQARFRPILVTGRTFFDLTGDVFSDRMLCHQIRKLEALRFGAEQWRWLRNPAGSERCA